MKIRYRWLEHFAVWVRTDRIAPPAFPMWINPRVPLAEHFRKR